MDDLIRRQAAIEAAWFLDPEDRDALRDTLAKLPSAEPERKHGKWIPRIATGNIALIECSECQFHYPELLGAFSFYYCPHCGAKMERSEE